MLPGNITVVEYLRSLDSQQLSTCVSILVLVIIFLLVAFRGRKVWLTADMIATVGFGASFVVAPGALLRSQVDGEIDHQLLSVSRLYGAAVLSSAGIWCQTRKTRDGTVPITLLTSRVIVCSLMLVTILQTHLFDTTNTSKPHWNTQHFYFNMVGTSMWLLGNLFHLLWSYDYSTFPLWYIPLNAHLKVEAWLTLLASISLLMFPDVFMKFVAKDFAAASIHLYMLRGVALFGLGSGIISLQASGFLHERDKKAQLLNTMLMVGILGLTSGFNHYWYGIYETRNVLLLTGGAAVVFTNALIGYHFDRTLPDGKKEVLQETETTSSVE